MQMAKHLNIKSKQNYQKYLRAYIMLYNLGIFTTQDIPQKCAVN